MPLVLEGIRKDQRGRSNLVRIIREADDYADDADMMRRVAENRMRLDVLSKQIEEDFPDDYDPEDVKSELDYIEASIQLGILQLTGELSEGQTSEELFEEEVALTAHEAFA